MTIKKVASVSFARPANTTAYAAGDIVANHATAGSVVVPEAEVSSLPNTTGKVARIRLEKSSASLVNAQFRVHIFKAAPVVASGDNAALSIAGVAAGYVGKVDITMDQAFSDGAFGAAAASLISELGQNNKKLRFVIEALAAYTPASAETFKVVVEFER